MGKHLYFNSERAFADYKMKIMKVADDLLDEYYAEVYNKLKTVRGKGALEKLSENQENYLRRKVIGYADAIMDSYGTGSLMDTTNPYLPEYKSSDIWNVARTSNFITGRKKGTYKNIYGATAYSKGNREGQNIEKAIKPRYPSYAFQHAQIWFFQGNRIKNVLDEVIRDYVYGMNKYFEFR